MKTNWRIIVILAVVTGLFASVIGTGCSPKAAEPIYIGMANPMTGDNAWIGETKVRGVELAVELANKNGGIDGREIKLVIEDDQGNPTQAVNVAKKLAGDEKILAVIGHWNSSCALAAIETYTEAGLPLLSDAASTQLSNSSDFFFRTCATDDQLARQMAQFMFEKKGHKNVAVLYPNNDYGVGANASFSDEFKKLGGTVLAEEAYFEGATSKDFTPQLTKVKGLNPDGIFLGGYYTEGALIMQQSRTNLDLQVPFYGTDAINSQELVTLGGDSVEGVTFVGFFDATRDLPGVKEYVEAFKAKYDMEPDTFGSLAFDSANLVIEAIRQNGATREGITKYLEEVEDFPGVCGPTTFLESGDVDRFVTLLTIKDGVIVTNDTQF